MRGTIGGALVALLVTTVGCATVGAGGDFYDDYGQNDDQFSDDVPPPPVPPDDVEPAAQVSNETFYEQLSPYGEWLEIPGYGRVWRPSSAYAGVNFRPYASGGHWVYTPYGWSFASDYPFAWAVYHYGRWALDANLGWIWVPGVTWGPAWVDWRWGGGYVGWAPLAPVGWRATVYDPWWCFVEHRAFVRSDVAVYVLPYERVRYVYRVTAPIETTVRYRGYAYYPGPSPVRVAEVTRTRVRPVPVQSVGGHPVPVPSARYEAARPVPSYPSARPAPSYPSARPAPSYPSARPVPSNDVRPVPTWGNANRAAPTYRAAPVMPNPVNSQRFSAPTVQRSPQVAPVRPVPQFQRAPSPAPTFRASPQFSGSSRPAPVRPRGHR